MSIQRIAIRKKNGREYAELVESYYDPVKKGSRSRYIAYLGVVNGYNEDGFPIIKNTINKTSFYDIIKEYIFKLNYDSEIDSDSTSKLMDFFKKLILEENVKINKIDTSPPPDQYDYYFCITSCKIPKYYELFIEDLKITIRIDHHKIAEPEPSMMILGQTKFSDKINKIISNKNSLNRKKYSELEAHKLLSILKILIQVIEDIHDQKKINLLSCLGAYEKALVVLLKYFFSIKSNAFEKNLSLVMQIFLRNGYLINDGNDTYAGFKLE
jgi:hypothetical protein